MTLERKSFLFYRSYLDAVNKIKDIETKYKLLTAIINYGLNGEEPEFKDELSQMAWVFIKPLLDANYQNYVNGCKGGAPAGNKNAKKQPKNNRKTTQNNPKQGNDNDNANDNDKDKVNDNANDNVNVNVNINKESEEIITEEDEDDDGWIVPYKDENGNWVTG